MKTILVTGATGFTGSGLAANLLRRRTRIIALVRNDCDGARTRKAVSSAAAGYGFDLPGNVLAGNLIVVEGMGDNPWQAVPADLLAAVNEVWHVAAEMNTRDTKFREVLDVNVTKTVAMYQYLARQAPACSRFYFVSSAYVAYEPGKVSRERLYCGDDCLSPYIFSKQCAEQALAFLSKRDRLPVSIFRPTFITGHEYTGWAVRNGLGLYATVAIVKAAKQCGAKRVTIPADGSVRLDLLPIDRLTDQAVALSERPQASSQLEIFHSCGGLNLTVSDIFAPLSELLDIEVRFGPPETALDKDLYGLMRETNAQDIFNIELAFDDANLRAAIGQTMERQPLGKEAIRNLFAWYLSGTV